MATPKKRSAKSPTPKSKAPAKKSAATHRVISTSKGIIVKTKDAVVEAVSTVVGGAVAGAAAAGTKLMEEKTGSVKKSVKKGSAGTTEAPAKKKVAATKKVGR